MKKIYMKPSMEVIKVTMQGMLASSTTVPTGGNYNGSGSIESRGYYWDDEE
jgi:hypothetical protein